MILPMLLSCAIGANTPDVVGTVGSSGFWHDHPVQDVHVADDGTLRSLAGCSVHRWSPDGTLAEQTVLDGCTAGLNEGFFSADGQWVAASGLWVGEQGIWRTSGGERAFEVETLDSDTRFCGGALWDIDSGLRRLDLQTGEVTRPTGGDHGTGFACIDDAWLLDEHGHRIDPDGTMVELPDLGDIRRIVGQTEDGRAIVYLYGEQLVLVDRDGGVAPGVPVVDTPEKVLLHDGVFHVLADVDDVVWHIDADGRLQDRSYAEGQGLGARAAMGALFVWNGTPWAWGGRRLFPLGAPSGPVDSTYERFFFDADELYLCHGRVCEARRLEALDGDVRRVHLPDGFSDESKLSPHARFLGQYDTQHLYRTTLDTGHVHAQPVSEWVDGLSVDAAGHFRWRLSQDEDEDEVYTTRVFEGRDGEEVVLGEWSEEWLADPGWGLLRLGPVLRWPNGSTAGDPDADNWFETPGGLAFVATPYGGGLEVYDATGTQVASSRWRVDNMGPWGDGAWVGRGRKVVFLGPDLTEKARLDIPWPLGDLAVDGAASPDGRYFAAQGPDGTLTVWRLPEALATSVGDLPAPEELPSHSVLAVGTQLGAPPFAIAEVSLFPEAWYDGELPAGVTPRMLETLGYTDEAQQVVTAIAGFAPRTQQERAEHLAAIQRLSTGWGGDDVYLLKDHFLAVHTGGTFYDEDSEERPGDAGRLASQLATAVKRHKARKIIATYEAWRSALPVSGEPAYGIEACPAQSAEVGTTLPAPPASTQGAERRLWDSIVVRVAADGTASWVGTEAKTRNSAGRACFEAHDGPWTPAQRGGAAVDLCVRVPCSTPAPSEE